MAANDLVYAKGAKWHDYGGIGGRYPGNECNYVTSFDIVHSPKPS